jgi:hypothetical protein
MAWRLTYQVNVDWVGAGEGPMSGNLATPLPQGGRGGAQTIEMSNAQGGQNSNVVPMTGAVVTALTNSMAADIAAQMNTLLGRINGFASGGG